MNDALPAPAYSRPLSFYESYFALSSMTAWLTVHTEGLLDLAALRTAWALLCRTHPVLTARIVPSGEQSAPGFPGYDLVVPAEPGEPRFDVHEGDGPVIRPLAVGEPVAFVDIALSGRRTAVSVCLHHSIADAKLAMLWCMQLFAYYSELVAGRPPMIEPVPVPKSPEELLRERGVTKSGAAPARVPRAFPGDLPAPAPGAKASFQQVRLSEPTTTRLRAAAKARQQTVHALVTGAIAVATRRFLPVTGDQEVDLVIHTPVDIRDRLDPPVPIWGGTNVIGNAYPVVCVRPDSDPVVIGADANRQVNEDLEAGVVQRSFLRLAEHFGEEQPDVPQVFVSNVGVVPKVPLLDEIGFTGLRGVLEFDWAPVTALLAARGHTGGHSAVTSPKHGVYTYDGQLSVDIDIFLPAERARAYAQELEAILVALAEAGA
ncbi:acyltransferase PapA5 [Segniliparus rotundus DSM 44985]|uniref:Phthiocerol/phthiodiolone dimycocerosyl transferase n=1 Tax=Segniliparus rotundus (strain ATCC BAA-972 / CDC 1076 / CIP 108378 / DSM 44985 / JCM 13578) TaxID=640132 RepID=D6ZBD7_SEGRD|nr:acyltransferase PapA5 [Segniliparus rotundus]ADG98889.1 acyltransferase PapA5 [Segniliparus rotundus DSM 44985]